MQDELPHLRVHRLAPAAAAENAVVASTLHFNVAAFFVHNAAAQLVRSAGLPRAGDIVQLAFNGEQCSLADVLRLHALGHPFGIAHIPGAMYQFELLEDSLNGFQVVVGIHVKDGVVLVVKLAVGLCTGAIAFDQVLEVVVVAGDVAIRVHGHKAGVLQKARVHAAACTRVFFWHAVNHIVFKPLETALQCHVVDRCGRFACIDRPTHHGHGQGGSLPTAGHE